MPGAPAAMRMLRSHSARVGFAGGMISEYVVEDGDLDVDLDDEPD